MEIRIILLVVWLYLQGIGHFEVVQQPEGCYWCVTKEPEAVTQLYLAESYGLAAHNYLAGKDFYMLEIGNHVTIEDDDGSRKTFVVSGIDEYRMLNPYLYKSTETEKVYTDVQLFEKIYNGDRNRVVLQTSIERDGNETWGLRFIIATPERDRNVILGE